LHNAVEQGLGSILPVCHQNCGETIVSSVVLRSSCNEGGVCLTVGINQQHTSVRAPARRSIPAMPNAALVAGVDLPTPPLWLVKTKTRVIAISSFALIGPDRNRCAGKDFAEKCYTVLGRLWAHQRAF
jgi:hypothetical protein